VSILSNELRKIMISLDVKIKRSHATFCTERKRHHALSYHYTREAVASKAMDFQFIPGHLNQADILSKHWGYQQQVWASAL
jgi:hypothetical protein